MPNPLLNDRDVSFLLYEVFDAASLLALSHFADHSRETFDGYIGLCARFAREQFLDGLVEGVNPARTLRYIGRRDLASPAPGSHHMFQTEQDALVAEVMRVGAREKATA